MVASMNLHQMECVELNEHESEIRCTLSFWVNQTVHYVELSKHLDDAEWQRGEFLTLDEEDGFTQSLFSLDEETQILFFLYPIAESYIPLSV